MSFSRMSCRGDYIVKCGSQTLWMKSEWSRFAFVHNAPIRFDQIKAVRPSCVRSLHTVIEAVNQGWEFDSQFPHARASDGGTFRFVARTPEKYLIVNIALHLPYVGGMGFQDVHSIKIDLALILLGQLVQGGNLPPKGRSRIAAEDQNDRLARPQGGELNGNFGIQRL